MEKVKTEINIDNFPERIRYLLENATVYDSSCHSGAKVYYIDSGYYIKVDEATRLDGEAKLSKLFYERGFGVEVVDYISTDKDYLVTRSAEGEDLIQYLDEPKKVCEILAGALLRLHEQPIDHMPCSARHLYYMELISEMQKTGLQETVLCADTLIHGDACLPNIIQNDRKFETFVDLGQAGAGDRHIDLYWAVWSLKYNIKTDNYAELFLDMYGREKIDEEKLRLIAVCSQ